MRQQSEKQPQWLIDPREEKAAIEAAIARAGRSLRGRPPLSLSKWADDNYYLSPEASSVQGDWETLPYQRAIMDAISNDDIEVITFMKSARVGYTKMVCAAIGYFAEHKQRSQVVYQPTDSDASDFVKDEIDPLLRDVPVVKAALKVDPDKKSKDNTRTVKAFAGSTLHILGGHTPRNFRRLTKEVVIYDELDGFEPDVGGEGSATSLGDTRITTATFPKSIRGSTPKLAFNSQIVNSLQEADLVFERYLPCPHCGHMQPLLWANMHWEKDQPETVEHHCESCGAGTKYGDLQDVDEKGRWQVTPVYDAAGNIEREGGFYIDDETGIFFSPKGKPIEPPRHVGFKIWAAYSYFQTWQRLASKFLEAKRALKTGDIEKLKTFTNTQFGEPWEEQGEKVDGAPLLRRCEYYEAEIPEGVKYLTIGADTQDDRVEYEVVGWGDGEESWSIHYGRIFGDLTTAEFWAGLAAEFSRAWTDAAGAKYEVRLVCIDSGGHFTSEVYQFSRDYGPAWIIPIKGASVSGKPIVQFPTKPNRQGVMLTMVGSDTAREIVYRRLEIEAPGPGFCHFPLAEGYNQVFFDQLTAWERVKRYSRGVPFMDWDARRRRHEVADCRNYAFAAIRLLQQHFGIESLTEVPGQLVADNQPAQPSQQSRGRRNRRESSFW